MANKLPWFTHDHDAHEDIAIRSAIRKHGHVAGWVWWCTLELLHKHGTGDTLIMPLVDMAASMMVDKRTCRGVYMTLCEVGLITRASYKQGPCTICTVVVEKFRHRQSKLKIKIPSRLRQNTSNTPIEREGEGDNVLRKAPLTDIQKIVNAYKAALGVPESDKAWDKAQYPRSCGAAKTILDAFVDASVACAYVGHKAEYFNREGLSWTLETIAKWAHNDKGKFAVKKHLEVKKCAHCWTALPRPGSKYCSDDCEAAEIEMDKAAGS